MKSRYHWMIKQILLLISSCMIFGFAYADTPPEKIVSKYLQFVYPTSQHVKNMSDAERMEFYKSFVFWYRVPYDQCKNGLYSDSVKPQYDVFLFPDTCARRETDSIDIGKGFTTDEVILGSNKNYIEVSTFGWMQFPCGGYYNWARGSGIYLNTGGKTIAAHSRVDLLSKLYSNRSGILKYIIGRLTSIQKQILGTSGRITDEQYKKLCTIQKPEEWNQDRNLKYDCMIKCLVRNKAEWQEVQQKIIKEGNPNCAYYRILMKIYIDDHATEYRMEDLRYNYLMGEANPALDEISYKATKDADINVIQFTRAPNSSKDTSFELCDVRWPFDSKRFAAYDSISGLQNYSLEFAYKEKVIKEFNHLQIRDPFDLENNDYMKPLDMAWPSFSDEVDNQVEKNPEDFDPKWLPAGGWGPEQAKGHYHKTDTFSKWQNTYTDMYPLEIPDLPYKKGYNLGRKVSWAVNGENEKSNLFSMTDTVGNVKKIGKIE